MRAVSIFTILTIVSTILAAPIPIPNAELDSRCGVFCRSVAEPAPLVVRAAEPEPEPIPQPKPEAVEERGCGKNCQRDADPEPQPDAEPNPEPEAEEKRGWNKTRIRDAEADPEPPRPLT